MKQLLNILAVLCAMLFMITGIIVLFLFNVERKAFVADTYKQAFEEQRLYERMPALLASTLQGMISQNPASYPFLRELSADDWQSTIASLLPPEELRAVADGALDSTFDYVNGRTDSAVITLLPIKARLAGPSGMDIVNQFLSTQPACTIEQLQQMALSFLGGNIALCNPPPEALGLIAPLIQSQMQTVTGAFPDQITIIPGTLSDTPNDPRLKLHMIRSTIRFLPFFVFLLLLAILVFAVRSIRDLLVWWGWPLMVTGFFSGIIALMGTPLLTLILQFFIQSQGAALLPPILAGSIAETAGAVARQVVSPVIWQGFVMAALGLFMVGLSLFLRRTEVEVVA